jgi:hypothetical protein
MKYVLLCTILSFFSVAWCWVTGSGPRFESPRLNTIAMLCALLAPLVSCLMVLYTDLPGATKGLALLVLCPVALVGAGVAGWYLTDSNCPMSQYLATDKCDCIYEVEQLQLERQTITGIVCRGDALSQPSTYVEQRWKIIPGLCWVNSIGGTDRASTVHIELLGERQLVCKFSMCDGSQLTQYAVIH